MGLPKSVRIVEVGPRDGLQNEAAIVPADVKAQLVERLMAAGLRSIEAGSFVPPKLVPQMASTADVLAKLEAPASVRLCALAPNLEGLERALSTKISEIAVFAAASETFSRKNINCSIAESLARYAPVAQEATRAGLRVRGYVSCALFCPFEGEIEARAAAAVARALIDIGCDEVSLADTIGAGTPLKARRLVEEAVRDIPLDRLAIHFHDTYGQALANIFACLELGVAVIDASVAGLGGCPFAPGATGNVATEDVVYMLDGMEIETGVDLAALIEAGEFITQKLERPNASRAARALIAKRARGNAR